MEEFPLEHGRLPGEAVIRLMRKYHVTIRELSTRTEITMKRIREVRTSGLADRNPSATGLRRTPAPIQGRSDR